MSTTEKPDTAPLAHKELDIPGRTGPVTDGPPPVWGINHGAALDNFPLHGLLCRAGPWGQMSTGDQVNIYWGTGQLVLPKTVQAHEVNTELQMFIAPKHLVEGTFAVSYTITRLNQTPEPSEVMHVEVKLTRPGGHDDTEEPGHPHLFMSIPREILESGVDKDNVAAGVDIGIGKADGTAPYPFAAAGDCIQVSWGGVFVRSEPLSQEQAEGKVPIVVHVKECKIREAGDSDAGGLSVAYEVYDRVYNRSEDWSVAQRVVVAVDTTLLNAPVLKEAVNNVLDVDLLGNADGTAQVVATNSSGKNDFEVGDTVYVRIKGTPQDGGPIDLQLPGFELINVPSIPEIKVPNTVLRQLAKRQIALSYSVKKDEDTVLRAKTQFIDAIGEIQRLAAPVAVEAQQGALDPTLAQVRIDIPFDESFALGQSIELYWHGTTPELKPYLPKLDLRSITLNDIEAKLPLRINVPGPAHLTPINGGTLELYYKLLIDDALLGTMNTLNQTHTVRESIHAEILRVGEPRQELPEPTVAGVVDGVLPPDTDGTTLTATAVDTVAKDEVTYRWVGSKTGEAWDMIVLNSTTAGAPVTFNIKAELIKGNEGGTVSATYEIKRFSGTTSYSNALAFRVGVALENPLPAPQMPEASGTGANVTLAPLSVQNGARVIVAYTGMDETHTIKLSMHGTPGPGSPDIPAKPGVTSGSIEFLIPATAIAANIGNSAKTFTLEYEVAAGTPIPSSPLTVSVTPLPATELDKISIEEAEGAVLDLTKVTAGATVLAGVWAFIAVNHRVKLIITGTKTNGDPLDLIVWPWPSSRVNQNWIDTGRYAYTLAYNAIKDLAHDSRLELHFKAALTSSQVEAEAIDAPVKVYTIKALLDLQPPTLVDAEDPIDVLAYPDGVTVRIEYPDALPGDRARLVEVNAPAGSPQFPLVEFNSNKRVNTVLGQAFLAARQGKVNEFRWNLNRNGGQAGKSPVAPFSVLKITDGDARLPTPLLSRASGDNLDVTKLEPADTISVTPWPHIPGELISLFLKGEYFDGTDFKSELVKNEPSTPPGFSTLTPFEELKKLKNNSNLNISLSTSADTSSGLITTKFPERNYKIQNTLLEENFDEVPTQSVGHNGTIETPAMTIKVLSPDTRLEIAKLDALYPPIPKPPAEAGKMYQNVLFLYAIPTATILIKFRATYSSISFWYNQTKSTTKVTFFGPNRLILGIQNFKSNESPSQLDNMTATYSEIIEMEITGTNDAYLLDCFTFKL